MNGKDVLSPRNNANPPRLNNLSIEVKSVTHQYFHKFVSINHDF